MFVEGGFNSRDPLFEESTVVNYGVPSHLNKDVRLSWTAYLNREPVTDQELEDHEVVKFVPPGRFLADVALDTPTTVNSRTITIGLILKMIMSSNMGIDCRLSL